MKKKEMIMLIEMVDELLRLDEAFKNLNNMGYQEKYPNLDHVYDILRIHSVFKDRKEDLEFYVVVEAVNETPETRAKILMGI